MTSPPLRVVVGEDQPLVRRVARAGSGLDPDVRTSDGAGRWPPPRSS